MRNEGQRDNSQHFLTLSDVQAFLGIRSRKTILKYITKGELSAYKLGGTRWRISRQDVEDFLLKQHVLYPKSTREQKVEDIL